jgi:hypothetical protein
MALRQQQPLAKAGLERSTVMRPAPQPEACACARCSASRPAPNKLVPALDLCCASRTSDSAATRRSAAPGHGVDKSTKTAAILPPWTGRPPGACASPLKPTKAARRPERGAVRPHGPARVVRVRSKSRLPRAPARASARYLGGRLWYSSRRSAAGDVSSGQPRRSICLRDRKDLAHSRPRSAR